MSPLLLFFFNLCLCLTLSPTAKGTPLIRSLPQAVGFPLSDLSLSITHHPSAHPVSHAFCDLQCTCCAAFPDPLVQLLPITSACSLNSGIASFNSALFALWNHLLHSPSERFDPLTTKPGSRPPYTNSSCAAPLEEDRGVC